MASSPCIFQVMIHHAQSDAVDALRLQRQLRRGGVRAGLADLSDAAAARRARHSLALIGANGSRHLAAGSLRDSFDLVLVGADAGRGQAGTPYRRIVARLTDCPHRVPISATALQDATRLSYDAIADQFADVWFDVMPGEALESFVAQLPRGASVLDAGCGPGHHARFFRQAGFAPVGLDLSRTMLDIATRKNHGIPFVRGDILAGALPADHFDAVWCAVALNHIPAECWPRALGNLVGTLRPGGTIGLNVQIGRDSEIVSLGHDHRFFEYPTDERAIVRAVEPLGVDIRATHVGTTARNIHGLPLEMRFATVVGTKARPA
ncbi:MAG: class I SAM-dependent methyltransferase [Rhodocyclaceae bacterium]|nr:class I SAM-dependent methyltransferase [Rhodocyclaceae bacterium]